VTGAHPSAGPAVVGLGELDLVAHTLDAGGVVAIPTDTVYGLAARVDRPDALAALFAIKGRPADRALPVVIAALDDVGGLATRWPPAASVLAAQFWPGPLTIVVPTRHPLGALLGGEDTLGLRIPDHQFVRALCSTTGPLAVTSANRHGAAPCTEVAAVLEQFGPATPGADAGAAFLVVDGGTCDGAPSTVVDCTVSPPQCLRAGALSWSRIAGALGI
jgi:L-threonylcarbamoyladenylate synthase